MRQYILVPFGDLVIPAAEWARTRDFVEPLTRNEQVLLMALEFAAPAATVGDADGVFLVANLEGGSVPADGMVGTGPVRVLRVTENLECYVSEVGGQEELITIEQLIADYAIMPVNPGIEGWLV